MIQSPRSYRKNTILFFVLLALFSSTVTFIAHYNRQRFDWRSDLFADKAGYYVYLPATFFFHFDYDRVPAGLDQKTGYGFVLNAATKKISTHYYYGEALLLSPFFLATHAVSRVFGLEEDAGFSIPYHRVMSFAAVFYLLLGLWFLKRFLDFYLKPRTVYYIIIILFLGTNLMYYVFEDPLMSHVYSFSMASVFLFLLKKLLADPGRYGIFVLMSLAFALLFIIRPTNAIFFLAFFFLDAGSVKDVWQRFRVLFRPKHILWLVSFLFIVAVPQMLYWKYLTGHYLVSSYGHTGFGNWDRPWFLEVWFAPLNGLFPWSPVLLFFVAGIVYMIVSGKRNGIFMLFIFLLVSYMAASWKYWYWGCGYGHRAFVEYYALLVLPFGFFWEYLFSRGSRTVKIVAGILIVLFTWLNFQLTGSMLLRKTDKCFFGSTWDWPQYFRVWRSAGLPVPLSYNYTYRNDFENEELARSFQMTDDIVHRGVFSVRSDPQHEYSGKFTKYFYEFRDGIPDSVDITFWMFKPAPFNTRALLVFSIQKDGVPFRWQSAEVDSEKVPARKWTRVKCSFGIPPRIPGDQEIFIYFWNLRKSVFYIDDMKITFRRSKP